MNKTAIKNFAIWARRKLISEITYKAGLIGVNEKGISRPLSISTGNIQFFDIGTGKPNEISDHEIKQRNALVQRIREKESTSDYKTAFQFVIEEVAYTWFNRLIAIRFMEVNDYLPSRIRVLSSETSAKSEPDMVTTPFDTDMEFSPYETNQIMQLKQENKLDELFRMLFIKQCNKLNEVLPELFEKTADYTELLLTISFTDSDGIVSHLVNDITEEDFTEAVEIIGWMYQYYNTEPKDEVFALLKKKIKISKERIPAATQLFTPDWIVRYMVENSLGRLWVEGHPNDDLKTEWKYYLEEAEQEENVKAELKKIRTEYKELNLEDIKVIDPCMGSGHILVYAFDVLMQIYESQGYTQRDAASSIIENNLYGLDIDDRAYQLAYFAVMMKARKYDRRFLARGVYPKVYSIKESNDINKSHLKYFGHSLNEMERNMAIQQIEYILETLKDAKEYGSIHNIDNCNWKLTNHFINDYHIEGQMSLESIEAETSQEKIKEILRISEVMANKFDVVITNPPYMGGRNMNGKLLDYIVKSYPQGKSDLYAVFILKTIDMTKDSGIQAMITQHSWMFLSSFEELRKYVLNYNIINLNHLGPRAFEEISGEVVQTASWVIRKNRIKKHSAKYLRLVNFNSQQSKEIAFLNREQVYVFPQEQFNLVPSLAFAYWIDNPSVFTQGDLLEKIANPRQGLKTLDNEYYIKFWFEIDNTNMYLSAASAEEAAKSKCKWFPINHGGEYRKYYGNNFNVVNWYNDGEEMKANAVKKYNSITRTITNISYYFKEGITWSVLCSAPSFRWYDKGFIFSNGGQCIVPDNPNELMYITGLLNSKISSYLLTALSPTLGFESGYLKKLPILPMKDADKEKVIQNTKWNIELSKTDWDSFEISWDFKKHPLLNGSTIKSSYESWKEVCEHRFNQLKYNEEELNNIFIGIYELHQSLTPEVEEKDVTVNKAALTRDIKSWISYSVGCIFGRYSLDAEGLAYAGGEWDDLKYTTFIPDQDNCIPITDEEYFEDDILGRFVEFVKCVYEEGTLEENLDFIAKALGNKGNTSREIIRNYFIKDFYKDHIQMYQKRPIYWLYDSGKQNGFKALVYMHRYTADTSGIVRVDYLHKMQKIYMSEIDRMIDTAENSNNAREISRAEKRKEKLVKQLKETKEYDEKIAHLAISRIAIDLDDGVKVNYEKVQTGQDGKKLSILAKI